VALVSTSADARPESQAHTFAESNSDARAESNSDACAEPNSDACAEPNSDACAEPRTDASARTFPCPGTRTGTGTDANTEPCTRATATSCNVLDDVDLGSTNAQRGRKRGRKHHRLQHQVRHECVQPGANGPGLRCDHHEQEHRWSRGGNVLFFSGCSELERRGERPYQCRVGERPLRSGNAVADFGNPCLTFDMSAR
jgi:hypothetical protein